MRLLAALVVLLLAAAPARAVESALVWSPAPAPAPAGAFTDEGGRVRGLGDYAGKVVLLAFWAPSCAPCRAQVAGLDRLQDDLGGGLFQVVPVALDSGAADVTAVYAELGVANLPVLVDVAGGTAAAFGIADPPASVLIDHAGREVARLGGAGDWSDGPARAALDDLVARARSDALAELSAKGCGCGGPKAMRARLYGTVAPPPEE